MDRKFETQKSLEEVKKRFKDIGVGISEAGETLKDPYFWSFASLGIPPDVARNTVEEVKKGNLGVFLKNAKEGVEGLRSFTERTQGGKFLEGDDIQALLGILGGPGAKTADLKLLERAKQLSNKGVNASEILHTTGWFKGKEDKWKFEINDKEAKFGPAAEATFKPSKLMPEYMTGPKLFDKSKLSEHLEHEELYKAYPELKELDVGSTGFNFDLQGGYSNELKKLVYSGGQKPDVMQTILHEVNHAVQHIEDFARGGNVEEFFTKNPKAVELKTGKEEYDKFINTINKADPKFNQFTAKIAVENEAAGKKVYQHEQEQLDVLKSLDLFDEFKNIISKKTAYDEARDTATTQYKALLGEAESNVTMRRFRWDELAEKDEVKVPKPDILTDIEHYFLDLEHPPIIKKQTED